MPKQAFSAENTLPPVLRLIRQAVAFLKEAGADPRALFVGELVLEEMLTNTVKYGYDDEARHTIEVTTEIGADGVTLEICDDGRAFDPLQAPPPFGRAGGRGIDLTKKMVGQSRYRREEGRNFLTLCFPARSEKDSR